MKSEPGRNQQLDMRQWESEAEEIRSRRGNMNQYREMSDQSGNEARKRVVSDNMANVFGAVCSNHNSLGFPRQPGSGPKLTSSQLYGRWLPRRQP